MTGIGRPDRPAVRLAAGVCAGCRRLGVLLTGVLGLACSPAAAPEIGIVLGSEGMLAARLAMDSLRMSPDPALRRITTRMMNGANSDAAIALAAAESLANEPAVVAVVGHSNSGASIAASQVYNARRIVQVAPTTTSPAYSRAGPFSFRLVPSDEHQARFLADHLAAEGSARLAIVHVNDDYGRDLHRLLAIALAERGLAPVFDGAYVERDSSDTDEMVNAIARARPARLVWLGRPTHFARLSPALLRALPALSVLASDGFGSAMVEEDARHRFNGVRYVRLADVGSGTPAMESLRRRYRAAGGGELTDQAAFSYDAVLLLAQAIREAGPDREAVRAWLASLGRARPPHQGVTGPISFSPSGDGGGRYTIVTVGAPIIAGQR